MVEGKGGRRRGRKEEGGGIEGEEVGRGVGGYGRKEKEPGRALSI